MIFLRSCWFSTFTKLFSKEVKITLLWWNLDNSSDLKLLKLNFLQSRYIKTLGSSFSNVVLLHHWWNQMMMINCSQSPEFSLWALKTLIGDSKSEMADGKGLLDVNLWTHVHPPPHNVHIFTLLTFLLSGGWGDTEQWGDIEQSYLFHGNSLNGVYNSISQNVCDFSQSLKVSAPHPPNFLNAPKTFDLLFLPKQVFKWKNLMPWDKALIESLFLPTCPGMLQNICLICACVTDIYCSGQKNLRKFEGSFSSHKISLCSKSPH